MSLVDILLSIVAGLLALVAWFFKKEMNRMEKELVSIRNDVYEFRDNYIDRFAEVTKTSNSNREIIIEKIHGLDLNRGVIMEKLNQIEYALKNK